jgi:serine protease Do
VLSKIGDFFLTVFLLLVVVVMIFGSGFELTPPSENTEDAQMGEPLPEWVDPKGEPMPRGVPDTGNRFDNRRILPPPSPFEGRSLVEADAPRNWTSGTAFAIASNGVWFTARHVVFGCDRIVVLDKRGRIAAKAELIFLSDSADVAIISTRDGPPPMALDLDETDMKVGTRAFHVGFPQGKPGEVTSKLIGRELMVTSGAWEGREQTLAFAETGRTAGLEGTLGGLSGGPAFDEVGNIIGITVAESPRRGRVVTTASESLIKALDQAGVQPNGASQGDLGASGYQASADKLRSQMKIVNVLCMRGR